MIQELIVGLLEGAAKAYLLFQQGKEDEAREVMGAACTAALSAKDEYESKHVRRWQDIVSVDETGAKFDPRPVIAPKGEGE